MDWGVLFAIMAALCTAAATVMQATGARRAHHYRSVDPRLLVAVLRSRLYLAGLGLLAASFVMTLFALRDTPLFVVQAITAASLAVIAAASVVLYGTKLHAVEWGAVAAVFAGVILLVVSQQSSEAVTLPVVGRWALLAAPIVLGVIAFTARRYLEGAAIPGLLAGLAFGDAAVASRVVASGTESVASVLAEPVSYSVVVAGLLGVLMYATALQRGTITAVFGMTTVGQTLGPAATGWFVLGDRVHAGMLPAATIGFALAVGGAILLGRHAHPERQEPVLPSHPHFKHHHVGPHLGPHLGHAHLGQIRLSRAPGVASRPTGSQPASTVVRSDAGGPSGAGPATTVAAATAATTAAGRPLAQSPVAQSPVAQSPVVQSPVARPAGTRSEAVGGASSSTDAALQRTPLLGRLRRIDLRFWRTVWRIVTRPRRAET